MSASTAPRIQEIIDIVQASPWFIRALTAVASLNLESWCIGAGAVRNLVWDHLHGYREPSALPDIDVAYFDATDLKRETEQKLQSELAFEAPEYPWEVTNQAAVHLWFEACFGRAVPPLSSLEEAVASWPEFATCVGITLTEKTGIQIVAPFGLDDLFQIRIRRNPTRVSLETYRQRTEQKQYAKRWPRVTVKA